MWYGFPKSCNNFLKSCNNFPESCYNYFESCNNFFAAEPLLQHSGASIAAQKRLVGSTAEAFSQHGSASPAFSRRCCRAEMKKEK